METSASTSLQVRLIREMQVRAGQQSCFATAREKSAITRNALSARLFR